MIADADRVEIVQYDAEVRAETRRLVEAGTPPAAAFWQAPVNVCGRRRKPSNVIPFPRRKNGSDTNRGKK